MPLFLNTVEFIFLFYCDGLLFFVRLFVCLFVVNFFLAGILNKSFFNWTFFFIYISNVFCFSGLPSGDPIYHPSIPCFYEGVPLPHPSTHNCLPTLEFLYSEAWSLPTIQGPLLPLMSNKAILST